MRDRRTRPSQVTDAYEDAGLFKKPLVKLPVELVPLVQRNLRQDVLVPAFVGSDKEITVVFGGRRATQATEIVKHLVLMRSKARREGTEPSALLSPTQRAYRSEILVEGSWRTLFQRDTTGWENRQFQLVAAQWRFIQNGTPAHNVFGSLPVR